MVEVHGPNMGTSNATCNFEYWIESGVVAMISNFKSHKFFFPSYLIRVEK